MVYCNKNQVESVKEIIASLDNNLNDMYYPVANITSVDEFSAYEAKRDLVVKLLNNSTITAESFFISGDLDVSEEGVKYVVYVFESPENIDLISNMWNKIG